MTNKLKQYFPMIREREELKALIEKDKQKRMTFYSWTGQQREKFLDMCCGARGVKILYDAFFKEIMNPEYAPERLDEFLSLVLGTRVKVRSVLPNDSTRIADESSLLITDIVVELEDGSLADVEVQKIGYMFPGERSACYSADMLLRQYRRVRGTSGDNFSYRNIKNVYTIILFEKSTREFHAYPDKYLHYFEQKSNTGLELKLLQKYVFVPLDIFRKSLHNKPIGSKLEAWLAFLCEDDPELIEKLIEGWPEFKPMYEQVYEICRNIQGVMEMFSKELQMLDQNTVRYMIDQMQETVERQEKELKEKDDKLQEKDQRLREVEREKQKAEREKQKAEQEKQKAEREKQEARRKEQQAQRRIAELEALLKAKSKS